MNVPDQQLTAWRAFAENVRQTTINAKRRIAKRELDAAADQLQSLHDTAIAAGLSLERAGAEKPDALPPAPVVPLHLLDTPASRRHLRALEGAYTAALDVDDERGYGREGAGPAAGSLEGLLVEAREEVLGPVGLARE